MRPKLKELLLRVEKEIKIAERVVEKNKKAANLIGGGMASGYSIAGDLEHARNTALLSEKRLDGLKNLQQVLTIFLAQPAAIINPPCFLNVRYEGAEAKELFCVRNPIHFPDLNLVSADSPLGKALLNHKSGDTFSYLLSDGRKITGEIILVE